MIKKNRPELVYLGNCSRVHGVKGAFVFNLANKESTTLGKGIEIQILRTHLKDSNNGEMMSYILKDVKAGNKVIVYIKGIDDRNSAEELIPFEVYVARNSLGPLTDSEFYLSDLIGFEVYEFDTRNLIGQVDRYYHNGAYEIVVIKNDLGVETDIPFIKPFIKSVSNENRSLVMMNLEGESE